MFWDNSLVGLFQKGGFAMWPLLACSVIGVAITLERLYVFIRLRFDYQTFLTELKEKLRKRQMKGAAEYCQSFRSPVARLTVIYLQNLRHDELRSEILKREGSLLLEGIETRLRGLATITHIAPLLGLLGTVTGLVSAFHRIEILGGQVQPGDLASGIWEALITTVFGLVIAIPSMAAYHGFESHADRIARQMQFAVSELDEFFGKHSISEFKTENVDEVEERLKAIQ